MYCASVSYLGPIRAAQYTLKKRHYLGTTSMPAEYSFVMANMAQLKAHDMVVDCFCGMTLAPRRYSTYPHGYPLALPLTPLFPFPCPCPCPNILSLLYAVCGGTVRYSGGAAHSG